MNQRTWWKERVFYQIYPMSFMDSNGDGIGDIQGIISRLPYLKELGIGGVWISPVFDSPLELDFGYGPKDLRRINPIFGTMEQFELLIEQAHALDIKIVMEWAAANTSIFCDWFVESRKSRANPKSDWYLWSDTVPNNWVSYSGGSAWHYCPERNQYYLGLFFREHAELNWRNPEVCREMMDIFGFWLAKGVDGFRVDAVEMYLKDELLRDNPLRTPDYAEFIDVNDPVMKSRYLPNLLPEWLHQLPVYDRGRDGITGIMAQMRDVCGRYAGDAVLIGEVDVQSETGKALCRSGLSAAFNFSLMFARWGASDFHAVIASQKDVWDGYTGATVFSNHDNPRSIGRFAGRNREESAARMKILAVLTMTLRALPMVYYGEEIGLEDVTLGVLELRDPISRAQYLTGKVRESSRGPMHWDSGEYGGFSDTRPWMKHGGDPREVNVALQRAHPDSIFNLYTRLISLRNRSAVLQYGEFELFPLIEGDILSFSRRKGDLRYIIAVNFSDTQRKAPVPFLSAGVQCVFHVLYGVSAEDGCFVFGSYGYMIAETPGCA